MSDVPWGYELRTPELCQLREMFRQRNNHSELDKVTILHFHPNRFHLIQFLPSKLVPETSAVQAYIKQDI